MLWLVSNNCLTAVGLEKYCLLLGFVISDQVDAFADFHSSIAGFLALFVVIWKWDWRILIHDPGKNFWIY